MILTTDAVVLKGMRYRESSKILTLYTRERGKLRAIAKGALRGKSRFGAALEAMSYVTAVLYVKETRDLQLLTQCDLVQSFRGLSEQIEKMAVGMAVIELLDAVTHDEERNETLFHLLVRTLETLNGATKCHENALYLFEVRLLGIMGFRPNFHSCVTCGRRLLESGSGDLGEEVRLGQSGAVCGKCSSRQRELTPVSPGALRVLQRMQEITDPEPVMRWVLLPQLKVELGSALRRLLQAHVDGLGPLKSQEVFSALGTAS